MSYVLVCAVALAASLLTFFSGFGLGTLLLPAFALFFPAEIAVSATAVVHLANNLFKLALVGRHADRRVALAFGLPAVPGAFLGAAALAALSGLSAVARWELGGRVLSVTAVKLVLAGLIATFALLELAPEGGGLAFGRRWLAPGGLVTGFFGGLSGHQGALRSAFLLRCELSKEAFIGTGVVSAVLVDLTRIAVYGASFSLLAPSPAPFALVAAATVAAWVGAWIGARLIGRVTSEAWRRVVGATLLALALALGVGLI